MRFSAVYRDMSGQPVVTVMPIDARSDDREERLTALFDAHQDRLYRLARRLTPSADDARDLVQETFLRAARSLGSVPIGLPNEEAWLVRVLINIRRDQWRKTAVRDRSHASLYADATTHDNHESALIAKRTVWRALDMLQPRRRAVVIMHELEGMTISAIASLLGISAITVRWHLSRGRRDLIRVLRPYIGDTT